MGLENEPRLGQLAESSRKSFAGEIQVVGKVPFQARQFDRIVAVGFGFQQESGDAAGGVAQDDFTHQPYQALNPTRDAGHHAEAQIVIVLERSAKGSDRQEDASSRLDCLGICGTPDPAHGGYLGERFAWPHHVQDVFFSAGTRSEYANQPFVDNVYPRTLVALAEDGVRLGELADPSHHGQHEFGSPVLPATAEALTVHYLDNLDAKLNALQKALAGRVPEDGNWTSFLRIFERRMYRGEDISQNGSSG